jgi:hypothetical protein
MVHKRDIAAFDARAPGYESGWLGRMHHQIADRTANLALSLRPLRGASLMSGAGPVIWCASLPSAARRPS